MQASSCLSVSNYTERGRRSAVHSQNQTSQVWSAQPGQPSLVSPGLVSGQTLCLSFGLLGLKSFRCDLPTQFRLQRC